MTPTLRREMLYDFVSILTSNHMPEPLRDHCLARIHDAADGAGQLAMRWAALALALVGDACMRDDPEVPAFDFEASAAYNETARARLLEFLADVAMIPPE